MPLDVLPIFPNKLPPVVAGLADPKSPSLEAPEDAGALNENAFDMFAMAG